MTAEGKPEGKTLDIDAVLNKVIGDPLQGASEAAEFLVAAVRLAYRHGVTSMITDITRPAAAIVPADRCSACNRLSRTMRNQGQGIMWCGRTRCLPAIHWLNGTYQRQLLEKIERERTGDQVSVKLARELVRLALGGETEG